MSSDKAFGLGSGQNREFMKAAFNKASGKFDEAPGIIEYDLENIREDPNNPRQRYDDKSLSQLADTIRDRGLLTPVSLRKDPDNPGKFIINHGHRRFRAAKLAGLTKVPAKLDSHFQAEDQIIDNIQHDNLDPLDIALALKRLKDAGKHNAAIARMIGKSAAFVTQHLLLLEMSPGLSAALDSGKISDFTVAADLVKLERTAPEKVQELLRQNLDLTRSTMKALKAELDQDNITEPTPIPTNSIREGGHTVESVDERMDSKRADNEQIPAKKNHDTAHAECFTGDEAADNGTGGYTGESDKVAAKRQKTLLTAFVKHSKGRAKLLLDKIPKNRKHAWIRFTDSGDDLEVPVKSITICEIE